MSKEIFHDGDKVYFVGRKDDFNFNGFIITVVKNQDAKYRYDNFLIIGADNEVVDLVSETGFSSPWNDFPEIVRATKENYKLLNRLFPMVDWEEPKEQ